MGRQRPALCGLGDLSHEGIAGRSRTASTPRRSSGWFGQIIQRSDDGGKTWHQPGTPAGEPAAPGPPKSESNKFAYDAADRAPLTTHQWYDGTQHPWEFKRVWHLEPSLTDPDTVYAGVEDAAIFRSTDGGQNWKELPGLRGHGTGPKWQPGAGGMCLHTIILDPSNPQRMYIAISAAGAFRTDDGGKTLEADQPRPALAIHSRSGCRSRPLRAPHRHESEASGRAVHAEALGRDALRRRRRQLERSQRQPADRLRIRDRRARARAGDDLRRPHQERLRALRARRQAARLPQPQRRQRVGSR